MRNRFWYIVVLSVFLGCSTSETTDDIIISETANSVLLLSEYVAGEVVMIDNVIACASGSANPNEIIAYVYPRPEATDIRFFETTTVDDDKNDYSQYSQINVPEEDFFNGYLKSFTRQVDDEKWIILSFRESGQIHLSNPIRLKHLTQNTVFTDAISIDQGVSGMPLFNWPNLATEADAIYFQVITDETNELLSGTYTFETQFQYYLLDNVVLNITEETPPDLIINESYSITLMGVSEDNWVNVFGQTGFITE